MKTRSMTQSASLKPPSEEQQTILKYVEQGYNVKVDAVAGSGKTTTCLHIARENPNKQVCQLTYNASLKLETRQRVDELGLKNMKVYSYHAFCTNYINRSGYTDVNLERIVNADNIIFREPFSCDILIIDEAQDMNLLFYKLVVRILKLLPNFPQIIVMGDRKQSIFAFREADSRFLTLAADIYRIDMKEARLSTSYRITDTMADFINECCRGALPMNSVRKGVKPKYVVCNPRSELLFHLVMRLKREQGYRDDEIFILSPSVKPSSTGKLNSARILANRLTQAGVKVFVSIGENDPMEADVLAGKLVVSTFHQSKGLERPVAIVLGFDDSYFEFYDKNNKDISSICNPLYVAITRAQKELILVHDFRRDFLPFLDENRIDDFVDVIWEEGVECLMPSGVRIFRQKSEFSVSELFSFLSTKLLVSLMDMIEVYELDVPETEKKEDNFKVPPKVKNGALVEAVSEINGTAIPAYFEYSISGKISLIDRDCQSNPKVMREKYSSVKKSFLKWATEYICETTGYVFKKYQIKEFDWISARTLSETSRRIKKVVGNVDSSSLRFEKRIEAVIDDFKIYGSYDMYNSAEKDLWEFKLVREVSIEHFLQLLVYKWILEHNDEDVERAFLFNIYDSRLFEINCSRTEEIIRLLINNKINPRTRDLSEADFLKDCRGVLETFE